MFSDRFDSILSILEVKGRELAEYADIDRTYISHFKNGKRTPSAEGKTMEKLTGGIIACARDRGKVEEIAAFISLDSDISEELLSEALRKWLMEEVEIKDKAGSRKRVMLNYFGDRLDRSIRLADLSNASLSRIINVDASLISRYRSGERMPRINSEIMKTTGNALWTRIIKNEKQGELAEYMSVDSGELDEKVFCRWLFEAVSDGGMAGRLIETFDSFSMSSPGSLPILSELYKADDKNSDKSFYQGIPGLRSAVLRFLGEVIRFGAPEVLLYSNQDMGWMVSEPDFCGKWGMLMFICVSGGTKIRIIHNIDRGMDEMIAAIKSWLPLYMSGNIEPYYSKKIGRDKFNRTVFLCPGLACVESGHVKGMESMAIYNYHTDEKVLKVFKCEMKLLFEDALPLMSVVEPEGVYGTKEVYYTPEQYERHSDEIAKMEAEDTGVRYHILKEASFNNISIILTSGYVGIKYETETGREFYFMHPVMINAFEVYVTENCQ